MSSLYRLPVTGLHDEREDDDLDRLLLPSLELRDLLLLLRAAGFFEVCLAWSLRSRGGDLLGLLRSRLRDRLLLLALPASRLRRRALRPVILIDPGRE